jgi:hypothetical protein
MSFSQGEILICSGLPDQPDLGSQRGAPYPNIAIQMAEVIHRNGYVATFEDDETHRNYVSLKAIDIWLPILQVAQGILIGISGGLFTNLIEDLLGERKSKESILHVEYRIVDREGRIRYFKASGQGKDVLKAVNDFEDQVRAY